MDTQIAQPDSLLKWMASLADATRLRLLRLLERHELAVSDLCDILQLPQSTVSRHLKLLGDDGWTVSRRRGTTNLYRMLLDELEPSQRQMWLLAREQTEGWAAVSQDQVRLTQRLRQRSEASQRFFAGAAEKWDRLRTEMYGPSFGMQAMLALLPTHWTVADLGCGTGALTVELSRRFDRVIAVDNTPAMLEAARTRTAEVSDRVELLEGDLKALPIEDNHCDAAMMVLVLTYLDDPQSAVQEMARILKPGGRAVVVDVMRHDREDFRREMGQQNLGYDTREVCNLLASAGLTRTESSPIPPHPDAKGPALLLATALKPAMNNADTTT